MSNPKLECPLCSEEVSHTKLGVHILSKSHREKLLSSANVRSLTTLLEKIDSGKSFDGKKEPPKFKLRDSSYQICLVCKKSYACSEHASAAIKHYGLYPKCAQGATEALREFLGLSNKTVKGVVDDEALKKAMTRIEALEKEIEYLKKDNECWKETVDEMEESSKVNFRLATILGGSEDIEYLKEKAGIA
jgi:hypothetical protein